MMLLLRISFHLHKGNELFQFQPIKTDRIKKEFTTITTKDLQRRLISFTVHHLKHQIRLSFKTMEIPQ